jgi:hypothetical protein
VGTSSSRRSPRNSMRWDAARAALAGDNPQNAATQLIVAAGGDTWPEMLRSQALVAMAEAAARGVVSGAAGLDSSGDPDEAVLVAVENARAEAIRHGDGGMLIAIAERSLTRVLLEAGVGQPDDAVGLEERARSSQFFAETMRQILLHLAARDLPGVDHTLSARQMRARTNEVAAAGVAAVTPASASLLSNGSAGWHEAVRIVFGDPKNAGS